MQTFRQLVKLVDVVHSTRNMDSSQGHASSSQLSQGEGRVLGSGKREREESPSAVPSTQELKDKEDAEREETPPPPELDEVSRALSLFQCPDTLEVLDADAMRSTMSLCERTLWACSIIEV